MIILSVLLFFLNLKTISLEHLMILIILNDFTSLHLGLKPLRLHVDRLVAILCLAKEFYISNIFTLME